jgi:hypothetical protein
MGNHPRLTRRQLASSGTIRSGLGATYKAKNWITQIVWMPGERENMLSQMALRLAKRPDWDWGRLQVVSAATGR